MSKLAVAVLALVCVMSFSASMSAQIIPRGNVYVGAAYASSVDVTTRYDFKGWNASAEAIPLSRFSYLGFVIDASGFYRPGITEYNILGGIRVAGSFGKIRPFVHVLGGIKRIPVNGVSYSPAAADVGGGVDYKLPFRNLSWRVQADYLHTNYLSASQNDVRASTGIVFRF